jgi:hypothetical protein
VSKSTKVTGSTYTVPGHTYTYTSTTHYYTEFNGGYPLYGSLLYWILFNDPYYYPNYFLFGNPWYHHPYPKGFHVVHHRLVK